MFISVMYVEHTWPPTFPIARTQPKTAATLWITIAFIPLEFAVCIVLQNGDTNDSQAMWI